VSRLARAWDRFWFAPRSTAPLALFRIAFGLLVTAWAATLAPDALAFLGPDGILPTPPPRLPGEWGLLHGAGAGAPAVVAVLVATLVGGVALTLGLFSRVAAVVVLVGVVSLQQRNPLVLNSGDLLIRTLAFLCALGPTGAALSLDRWRAVRRTGEDFWRSPERAPWALRLIQVQLSVGYLAAALRKVATEPWRDGTAVAYALRTSDFARLPVPGWLTHSVLATEVLTFSTVVLELSLAVLVWNRAARPYVLSLGVALHLGIDYALVVGFFGLAILVAYVAFVPPDTADRLLLAVRDRLRRPHRPAGEPPDGSSVAAPADPPGPQDVPVPARRAGQNGGGSESGAGTAGGSGPGSGR
jgi:hypothetical protein